MDEPALAHLAYLEKLGYEAVLLEMAKGEGRMARPGSEGREAVENWLRLKESERALASSTKRDAREERTLAIAEEANTIARAASRWAMWAAIAAIIAIVIATKDQILALIF